ncbi:MAG: hypothetical protein WB586_27095 [Chthoniobacterales bacterium]
MNAGFVILPYRLEGVWVFDDAAAALVREPFISGAGPDYSDEKVLTANIEPARSPKGKFDLNVAGALRASGRAPAGGP